jgi:UDP-N-acetylmuramoylalanine--D-glutamate ligase
MPTCAEFAAPFRLGFAAATSGGPAPASRPAVSPPGLLAPLLRRPVAIFGGGLSGQAAGELLGLLGARSEIFDEKAAAGATQRFDRVEAGRHRLVVFSPGFAPDHAWLQTARAAGCTCLGELDFASLFWRGRLVAITGTNGKTTLTEFLTHALGLGGETAFAVGNVGFPFSRLPLQTPAAAVAVCEVSSFQAETLRHFRADAALWTNFAEDHLERHAGLEGYFAAKWNLVDHTCAGAVFAGSSVQRFARRFGRRLPPEACIATEDAAPDARLGGTPFALYPHYENFLLALAWWRHTGRPEAALYAATRSFRLGRHRLALVGGFRGVSFWNDSKATNFHAVEAALATFSAPVHLILGGRSKGGDLRAFVSRIAGKSRNLWLIGETRAPLAELCAAGRIPHTVCASLEEAVRGAAAAARPGEHVVLSPAFASFDMFRSYADRGDQFERLVAGLGATSIFQ